MAQGNGVDLGAVVEMLKGLVVSQDRMAVSQDRMALDIAGLKRDLSELRIDMVTLRQEVVSYHSSVVGHGMLISELDERVTRLEGERPSSGRA